MGDHRVMLNEAEVAYLLKLVREDIRDATDRGEGEVNLTLHNRLAGMDAWNRPSPHSEPR